jgi:hypothetical protein
MSKDTIKILNFRNLDFDKLEYYQPNQTNYGSHIGNISYRLVKNNVMPVYIETPKLITTSGIIKIDDKFYMEFEIDLGNNDNPFYDFITKFDEKNIINCHFNSKSWFNKQIPYNVIEDYYKSPLKLQSSRKNPIFKVRLPSYRGKVLTEIYNQKKELVDISKVNEGDEVVGIIGFAGLRFLSHQFVAEWELYKLKLLKDTSSFKMPSGYLFSDLESGGTVKTTVEEKTEEDTNTVEGITEEASTLVEGITEEASTLVEGITEEASNLVEGNTEEVKTPVEETPEEVKTPVEETPEEVKTPVEETPEEVKAPVEEKIEEVSTPAEEIPKEVKTPIEKKIEEVSTPVEEIPEEVIHTSQNTYQNTSTPEKIVTDIQKENNNLKVKEDNQENDNNIEELEEELEENLEEESDDEFYDSEFELDDDLLEGVEVIN